MFKKYTGFSNWQWLEMAEGEHRSVAEFKTLFNDYAARAAAPALTLEIEKAALTVTCEEARRGTSHRLADGTPFYRITVTAKDHGEGLQVLNLLSQHFGAKGEARLCTHGQKPALHLDRKHMLPVVQLAHMLPHATAAARK